MIFSGEWAPDITFLYSATLKSGGYYVIPSIQKIVFQCLYISLYVRPSAHRFHSLLGAFFLSIFLKLAMTLILGRSVLGM